MADITLRALETLKAANIVAAEDTRHSKKLLTHYQIATPLERLDAHTIGTRAAAILDAHNHVAYVTDAGTPGISDPGAELLRLALNREDEVEVLPGATAFVPALVLSGLPTKRFTFEGFLPRKGQARAVRLKTIAEAEATSLIYESPKRLSATLKALADVCGPDRLVSVSREISKRFETTYRGTLEELSGLFPEAVKGEIVIAVAPGEASYVDAEAAAKRLRAKGLSGKALRRALMSAGVARNEAYRLSLE